MVGNFCSTTTDVKHTPQKMKQNPKGMLHLHISSLAILVPQQRIRSWGLPSVKQARVTGVSGHGFPMAYGTCARLTVETGSGVRKYKSFRLLGSARSQQSFRWDISLGARREIQVRLWRENAAVVLPEHAFIAQRVRSKCACGAQAQLSVA